jgi:hypothetical protein
MPRGNLQRAPHGRVAPPDLTAGQAPSVRLALRRAGCARDVRVKSGQFLALDAREIARRTSGKV